MDFQTDEARLHALMTCVFALHCGEVITRSCGRDNGSLLDLMDSSSNLFFPSDACFRLKPFFTHLPLHNYSFLHLYRISTTIYAILQMCYTQANLTLLRHSSQACHRYDGGGGTLCGLSLAGKRVAQLIAKCPYPRHCSGQIVYAYLPPGMEQALLIVVSEINGIWVRGRGSDRNSSNQVHCMIVVGRH